jgi:hypothetical protein
MAAKPITSATIMDASLQPLDLMSFSPPPGERHSRKGAPGRTGANRLRIGSAGQRTCSVREMPLPAETKKTQVRFLKQ